MSLSIFLTSFATLLGIFGTLCSLTFLMAGGANSTPEQIRTIKQLLLAAGVLGVASIAGAIVLLVYRQPIWSPIVGVLPLVVFVVAIAWALIAGK